MDIDGNGVIHWNEFLSTMMYQTMFTKEANLKEAYLFFDTQKKGYFDIDDFKNAIVDPHLTMITKNSLDSILEEAFHGNKHITYDDFKKFML
jgi:Ca2+-binding EF-hand superfamily protein